MSVIITKSYELNLVLFKNKIVRLGRNKMWLFVTIKEAHLK